MTPLIPLLGAAVLALALQGAQAREAPAPLKPCRLKGVENDALCGSVRRPLDPARADGPQIDVHFAVLPALARNKRPDPVFLLAGGPGQSAIGLAGSAAALFARLQNRRDVVLVDQRGTGRSAPLQCPEPPPNLPLAQSLGNEAALRQLQACRATLQALPHGDLRHYTTTLAMADIDAVRRALGAERINVVGGSYGTRAALELMRLFPAQVRRVVLDGVAPPDMALPLSFSPDSQAALDAVFAACEADAACRQRHPRLRERWRAMAATLPRDVTVQHPVTGVRETLRLEPATLGNLVRLPLYAPVTASVLPAALDAAIEGRFEPLLAMTAGFTARRESQLAMGMHLSVICSEDLPRMDAGLAPAEPQGADFGDRFAAFYRSACTGWPRGAVPEAFYRVGPAPVATLVLSGGADPATPPRHGARTAQALGDKARHVVVPQAGHGVMGVACMRDVLFRFIDAETDTAALAVDTGCAAAMPRPTPFVPPGTPATAPEGSK